jgi:hypothetical protein
MAVPSIQYLTQQAIRSFCRFPSVILSALIAAIAAVVLISMQNSNNHLPLLNIMLCAALGIPLFFSLIVFAEKKNWEKNKIIIAHIIVAVLLVILYFTFPSSETVRQTFQPYLRYVMYAVSAHLTVSFIPFIRERQINGFWQYNRMLFLRLFVSVLYAAVLFAGISIAIVAVDQLFGVQVHYTIYGKCFAIIAFVFHTWFFISGIPKDIAQLENELSYPKGLRIFAQFVLLSLLTLYMLILYTYGTKIIATWNWPKGIVTYLIIYVSVLGTLTFLLLYPYGKSDEYKWLQSINKWFYILMIPLLAILFMAIFMRIDDYGITENRYIILALGIWLSVVSIYHVSGKTNIKFIPTSLTFVPLLISVGPWSMFSVSQHYQVNRLQRILEKNNILVNGKIQNESLVKQDTIGFIYAEKKNNDKLSDSLKKEVVSILRYLDEYHGFSAVQPWFTQNLEDKIKKAEIRYQQKQNTNQYNEADIYLGAMGLNKIIDRGNEKSVQLVAKEELRFLDVEGYDAMTKVIINKSDSSVKELMLKGKKYLLSFDTSRQILFIQKNNQDSLELQIGKLLNALVNNQSLTYIELPANNMYMDAENQEARAKIYLSRVSAQKINDLWILNDAEAWLLMDKK